MIRSAILLALSLLLSLVSAAAAQPAKKAAPWRLALVSSSSSETTNNLIDLVQAKQSADDGLELLERKMVSKILAEQKLSLSGLVESNFAVKAGQLLNADAFALVETDPSGKSWRI